MPTTSPPARTTGAVDRHPLLTIAAHWTTLACLVIAVSAVLARGWVEGDAWRAQLLALHRQAALTVLLLLVLRLAARLAPGRPGTPSASATPRWLRLAARLSHLTLYAALLLVPLLGSALSDARGQHTAWLGWLQLPPLATVDPDLADTLEDRHRWAAWALGALVLLHASAALWHHWVRRDDVLRAMWPARRRLALPSPSAHASQGQT